MAKIPLLAREWRQLREIQKDTHETRVERSRAAALRGLARYATLHGVQLQSVGLRAVVKEIAADALQTMPEGMDLEAYAEDYAKTQAPLLADEIGAARERLRNRRARKLNRGAR